MAAESGEEQLIITSYELRIASYELRVMKYYHVTRTLNT